SRAGLSETDIATIVEAIARAAGDEECVIVYARPRIRLRTTYKATTCAAFRCLPIWWATPLPPGSRIGSDTRQRGCYSYSAVPEFQRRCRLKRQTGRHPFCALLTCSRIRRLCHAE